MSTRTECELVDLIPIDNRLRAARLDGSVRVNNNRLKRHCLLAAIAYASADSISFEANDKFNHDLF